MINQFTVVPTTKARVLCVLMPIVSLALAIAAFVFTPDMIQSGSREVWVPVTNYDGSTGHQWGGYEAVYNGNPWYYGIAPGLIVLGIALFASLGVASHYKLIDWKKMDKPLAHTK